MRSASNLSVEEKASLCVEFYAKGMSSRDIQVATGIGRSSVSIYLKSLGVIMDGPARISAKMTGRPGVRLGAKHTDATKLLMSNAAMGHKRCVGRVVSQETVEKIRVSNRATYLAKPKKPKPPKITMPTFVGPRKPRGRWLHTEEKVIRDHVRQASKRMLRRVLTMARVRKDLPTERLLGYTQFELRKRLESTFADGMSWKYRDSFHIDHIVPAAHFFRSGIYDPAIINALSNLQALTPEANRAKSDRVISTRSPDKACNRIITITDAGAQLGIQALA